MSTQIGGFVGTLPLHTGAKRNRSLPARAATLPLAALLACLGGCGHLAATEPIELDSSSLSFEPLGSAERTLHGVPPGVGRQRYPLAIGNSWDYLMRAEYTRVVDGQTAPPTVSVQAIRDELVGLQHYGSQDYFVMESSYLPAAKVHSWIREDSDGLFVALAPSYRASDVRAAGGTDANVGELEEISAAVDRMPVTLAHREAYGRAAMKIAEKLALAKRYARTPLSVTSERVSEQQWLAYPLHVGARWKMVESPDVECTVTSRERIEVPAGTAVAWRVRVTAPGLGDDDRVESWYSAAGLVRYRVQTEQDVVDAQGIVIGTLRYDGDQVLTAIHLEHTRPSRRLAAGR